MVKPASQCRIAAALLFAAPVALLSACSPNEPVATQPGTVPPVWTGSPAPSAPGEVHGQAEGMSKTLTTELESVDGEQVAAATIDFSEKFATITVQTTGAGRLAPGLHGLALHAVGKCEPNSVAPTGGAPGNFLSAGAPLQGPGGSGGPAGVLVPLQVREDGTGMLVTTTDAIKEEDLLDADNSALVLYDQSESVTTNQTPLTAGVAGKRVACGVIGSG